MMEFEDALKLTTIKEIDAEIDMRIALREHMVGQLYPSILSHEIYKLKMRRREIEDENR